MQDGDRALLAELSRIGRALTAFGLGIVEGHVSRNTQIALGTSLVNLAERIHDRALNTPLVIEGELDRQTCLPDTTVELDWR